MAFIKKVLNPCVYRLQLYCTQTAPQIKKPLFIKLIKYFEENDKEYDAIIKNNNLTTNEWANIRKLVSESERVKPSSIDSVILETCTKQKHIDIALSYYKFLKDGGYDIHLAVAAKYLKLFVFKPKPLTKEEQIDIIDTYKALRVQHPYLDAETTENCILGLCLTHKWKEACSLLEEIKLSDSPKNLVYSAIIAVAFRNNEPKLAWKYLEELRQSKFLHNKPQSDVYNAYLEYCQMNKATFNANIEKMFEWWRKYNVQPPENVIINYIEVCNKLGWTAKLTNILLEKCSTCNKKLLDTKISDAEFKLLFDTFEKKVLVANNIYYNSSPEEFKNFKKYVQYSKPFDIVIDGLNVVYNSKNKSKEKLSGLFQVVDYFLEQKKSILVIGRKHLLRDPLIKNLGSRVRIYFLNDLTNDDSFLLYATLASGNNSKFLSKDLMRQHKFMLENNTIKEIFKKWQLSHQYFLNVTKNKIVIKNPMEQDPYAQKNKNSWHIPYKKYDIIMYDTYNFPELWACFKC